MTMNIFLKYIYIDENACELILWLSWAVSILVLCAWILLLPLHVTVVAAAGRRRRSFDPHQIQNGNNMKIVCQIRLSNINIFHATHLLWKEVNFRYSFNSFHSCSIMCVILNRMTIPVYFERLWCIYSVSC